MSGHICPDGPPDLILGRSSQRVFSPVVRTYWIPYPGRSRSTWAATAIFRARRVGIRLPCFSTTCPAAWEPVHRARRSSPGGRPQGRRAAARVCDDVRCRKGHDLRCFPLNNVPAGTLMQVGSGSRCLGADDCRSRGLLAGSGSPGGCARLFRGGQIEYRRISSFSLLHTEGSASWIFHSLKTSRTSGKPS